MGRVDRFVCVDWLVGDLPMTSHVDVPLQYITMVVTDASHDDEDSRKLVELIAEKNLPPNCRVYRKNWTQFLGEGIWQLSVVYYEVPND